MPRALISLYVLLTTRLSVPWTLLTKGAAIVLTYAFFRPLAPSIGIDAVNMAVLAGLLVVAFRNLPRQMKARKDMADVVGIVVGMILATSAVTLYIPAALLPYVISVGLLGMAAIYAGSLLWDRSIMDEIGWTRSDWGGAGQINVLRWQILRCVGLAVANAYAATYFSPAEWVVTYAVLPVAFYAVFHWSVIATHPFDEDV